MKRNFNLFARSFFISLTVFICFYILIYGICESYEQIRRIGFNEYKNAVEYSNGVLRILDFTFKII